MTTAAEAIVALRAAVAKATQADDEALGGAAAPEAFVAFNIVSIPGESSLSHVSVRLAQPVRLQQLEAAFGQARELPRSPDDGATRTVIFGETIPAEGSAGATLLADVQRDGLVSSLVVRRDVL